MARFRRLALPAILGGLFAASTAAAEPTIDLQQFHPPATSTDYLGLDAPGVLPHLRGAVGLMLSYGHDALLLRDGSDHVVPGGALVRHQVWMEAVGSVGLFDRFELGLALPVALYQGGDDAAPGVDLAAHVRAERGAGLGDLRLDGKMLILDHVFGRAAVADAPPTASPNRLRLALLVGLTAPTGTTDLAGDTNVTGRPRVVVEWVYRRVRLAGELGAIFRPRQSLLGLDVTHQLTWGLGLRVLVWRALELLAEARGAVGVAPPRGAAVNGAEVPAEAELGLSYGTRLGLRFFAAGGLGLGPGYGSPNGRLIVGARFVIPERHVEAPWPERDDDRDGIRNLDDRCVRQAGPVENGGCPDEDQDHDGVIDRLDRCPEQAGVVENGGCPDYDADGDGIPDRVDRCPQLPGPASELGCPAPDADSDGVPDATDRCPDQAGSAENDGCPDLDSDGDGLVDRADKCPFDAEVYNGVADEDGCPDAGTALAKVSQGQIALFEPIEFEKVRGGERIAVRSLKVIAAVGALLRAHKEITALRVDGHTDNRGKAVDNLDLSLRRAQLVRRALIDQWKIEPKRVTAQGFGANRPIVANVTPQNRARNRRIELTIVSGGK